MLIFRTGFPLVFPVLSIVPLAEKLPLLRMLSWLSQFNSRLNVSGRVVRLTLNPFISDCPRIPSEELESFALRSGFIRSASTAISLKTMFLTLSIFESSLILKLSEKKAPLTELLSASKMPVRKKLNNLSVFLKLMLKVKLFFNRSFFWTGFVNYEVIRVERADLKRLPSPAKL